MNDQFLYQLYEEPESEFAKSLRQTLNRSSSNHGQDENAGSIMSWHPMAKRIALALVALILAFALAITISPAVRAAVTDIIETIIVRGTTVWVSDDVPAVRGKGESYSEIWTPLSPSEIAAGYPDFAKLPAWVPPGYLLQERAAFFGSVTSDIPYSVLFEWKNKQGDTIQLDVSKGSCPNGLFWETGEPRQDCTYRWSFNVDSAHQLEVITINEQPAVLLPGLQLLADLSDPVQQWNPSRGTYDNRDPEAFFLIWEADGMKFELATKSPTISINDLKRLAESMP
jgi:hypothetical protein